MQIAKITAFKHSWLKPAEASNTFVTTSRSNAQSANIQSLFRLIASHFFSSFLEVQGAYPSCCNFDINLHSTRLRHHHHHHLTSCSAQNHVHRKVCTYEINIRCKIILYALRYIYIIFFKHCINNVLKHKSIYWAKAISSFKKIVIRPSMMPANFLQILKSTKHMRMHTHKHIQLSKKI